jgi:hypothetical protein
MNNEQMFWILYGMLAGIFLQLVFINNKLRDIRDNSHKK